MILGSPNEYFNPNAFVVPAPGTYGNLGRDTLTGPGIANLDFSALKNTSLTERFRLQFRAEFFNIANRTNSEARTQSFSPLQLLYRRQRPV